MSIRGILYIVWGNGVDSILPRSIASVRQFHPDLPVHVHRAETTTPGSFKALAQKAAMARLSPFAETLFLDADTTILGNLDYGFDMAKEHGLACTLCESPLARRHAGLRGEGDLVEYNTGVLFFSAGSRALFDAWERLSPIVDSSTIFMNSQGMLGTQDYDDQGAFALAVKETRFVPFTLPLNWNFRPKFQKTFFGPLKIWHDYSPPLLK
jgi:hypothetical protein